MEDTDRFVIAFKAQGFKKYVTKDHRGDDALTSRLLAAAKYQTVEWAEGRISDIWTVAVIAEIDAHVERAYQTFAGWRSGPP